LIGKTPLFKESAGNYGRKEQAGIEAHRDGRSTRTGAGARRNLPDRGIEKVMELKVTIGRTFELAFSLTS